MPVQDDARENEMRSLFNLDRPEEFGRADIDAVLTLLGAAVPPDLQGKEIPFELKSATGGTPDISTVRDLGPHHLAKWRNIHWLFGVYDRNAHGDLKLQYCLYGPPSKMRSWMDSTEAYARADYALAGCVPDLLGPDELTAVLGDAAQFTSEEAKRLMKNQFRTEDYRRTADLPGRGYSRAAMLKLLRARCTYLIERGSTRNNPHIPATYFEGWEQITSNQAARLRELAVEELRAAPGETAPV